MKRIVKQLRHGQITIPKEFREALALQPDDLLAISLEAGKLEIEPVRVEPRTGRSGWAAELYQEFATVRESLEGRREEEVNQAIDEAVKEARARAR